MDDAEPRVPTDQNLVPPLTPADIAAMLVWAPADAFEAHLVSGGLLLTLEEGAQGADIWGGLEYASSRPTSTLLWGWR